MNRKSAAFYTILSLTSVLSFQNCTPQSVSTSDIAPQSSTVIATSPSSSNETQTSSLIVIDNTIKRSILSVRFIKNSGFRLAEHNNQDIQIIKNRDGSFQATSQYFDPECFKVSRRLNDHEQNLVTEYLGNLKVDYIQRSEEDPIMVDGGFARLEIVWLNGKSQVVELVENPALLQYQLARNGEDFIKIFNYINNNFEVVCQ